MRCHIPNLLQGITWCITIQPDQLIIVSMKIPFDLTDIHGVIKHSNRAKELGILRDLLDEVVLDILVHLHKLLDLFEVPILPTLVPLIAKINPVVIGFEHLQLVIGLLDGPSVVGGSFDVIE